MRSPNSFACAWLIVLVFVIPSMAGADGLESASATAEVEYLISGGDILHIRSGSAGWAGSGLKVEAATELSAELLSLVLIDRPEVGAKELRAEATIEGRSLRPRQVLVPRVSYTGELLYSDPRVVAVLDDFRSEFAPSSLKGALDGALASILAEENAAAARDPEQINLNAIAVFSLLHWVVGDAKTQQALSAGASAGLMPASPWDVGSCVTATQIRNPTSCNVSGSPNAGCGPVCSACCNEQYDLIGALVGRPFCTVACTLIGGGPICGPLCNEAVAGPLVNSQRNFCFNRCSTAFTAG